MKIRTRLTISIVIFIVALLLIAVSLVITYQRVDRLTGQEDLAKQIEIEANDLSYLSSDYVLYPDIRQAGQWKLKYETLASDLLALAVDKPDQQLIVNNLKANSDRLGKVFDDVQSGIRITQGNSPDDPLATRVSWNRLEVQIQGIISDSGRLSQLLRNETDMVKFTSTLLISLLLVIFSLFILTSYLLLYRRTLSSIADLQEGAKVIGSGDLSHTIPEKGDDEIRDLVRAFNTMAASLRQVTASKKDLEREVLVRKKAEEELGEMNEELNATNEELTATQEELHQNIGELTTQGHQLSQALAEKEILLSEIHHRVKNNLAAFISLLSLEGTIEETPAGRELKKELQNRARSMALIHETLYRTHKYSEVDMDQYLTPLVNQIVNSYSTSNAIRTIVEARGVGLDINRATPIGLIVNEIVTNSLKHGFTQEMIASRADGKDPCTIGVRMVKEKGAYLLKVCDNGVGMPAGFDPLNTKSLGLKLVNFLAKHQLRATVEVNTANGTEFVFRFSEKDDFR